MFRRIAALVVLVAVAGGCSSIPTGGDPTNDPKLAELRATARPKLGRIAIAPVLSISLASDEAGKGWRADETRAIAGASVLRSFAKALEATGTYDRVRLAATDSGADTWRERDDFLATITVENVRTRYDGHNVFYVPNLLNWLFFLWPAWFVATEDYSLTLDATITLTSAESQRVLGTKPLSIGVNGTFDQFDVPWHFFGVVGPTLDAETWRSIAESLFPAAEHDLAVALALQAEAVLRAQEKATTLEAKRRKTVVLAVGVSVYEDPTRFPAIPDAANDARAFGDALVALGVPRSHVATLVDRQATAAAVRAAIASHLARVREGDGVIVYFAGYGTRQQDGQACLVFHDSSGDETGRITLAELAELVGKLPGSKLVVIDAGFAGRGRSVAGVKAATGDDLAAFKANATAAILAGDAQESVLASENLHAGLLTFFLDECLNAAAKSGATPTASDLFEVVRGRVAAEAAFIGDAQTPRAVGLDHAPPFGMPAVAGESEGR